MTRGEYKRGHRPVTPPPVRFWKKVNKRGPRQCWEWTAAIGVDTGYGMFNNGRGTVGAHRFAYEDRVKPIPPGFLVMHSCDNRSCCNPGHLSAGTYADNNADMTRKGRRRNPPRLTGESHPLAKLTYKIVRECRTRRKNGESNVSLAREFRVSTATMSSAIIGKTWK